MPPAILADSDDDGDDIAAIDCGDEVSSSRGSRPGPAEGPTKDLDGANDGSTGSTELLRRQIQSAERGLLSNSAPTMNQQSSSASPAMQTAKRRHTAAFASESSGIPEKGVKRSRTLKMYGASRRQIDSTDDTSFDHFCNDEGPKGTSSQTARFSENSGYQSSIPLPAGSLQTDFLDHEPAVMFKDTGDTVADASSEQQRLYDQAMALNKGLSPSVTKEAPQASEQQSSSIPWTASDIANSVKSKKSQPATQAGNEARDGLDEANGGGSVAGGVTSNTKQPAMDGSDGQDSAGTLATNESTSRKPKSSPMVEIPRHESRRQIAQDEPVKSTQRAAKKRNREAEEDGSEPLNSEDRAVGLPKERYQPRPSKRRTTHIIEEPIDYSVRPEKAAKTKRTKSAGAKVVGATEKMEPELSPPRKQGVISPQTEKNDACGETSKGLITAYHEQDESSIKPRRQIKQPDTEGSPDAESTPSDQAVSADKSKIEAQDDADKIFVKPAIPTPKPKSATKVKRAQTTIFEDHVEFIGSRRSPNLSQQQAMRKSALQDLKNEVVSKSQRKRKSIVADDSDDEDELAKENDTGPAKAESPPKKRRGRPPKQDNQIQPKATDPVPEEPDGNGEKEIQAEAEEPEVEAPPKKRGRGRAPKAASKTAPASEEANEESTVADETQNNAAESSNEANEAPQQSDSTPSKPNASATKKPTPSPDRRIERATATPQKAATLTAQHSPIKSSSKVPLRVGLSKSHRIPSLLRFTRPPKR